MRKLKRIRRCALPFHLLLIVAGALLLMAAFAPKANADVLIYFNFEDATIGGPFDPAADVVGAPDFNPGGGVQASTITTNLVTTGAVAGTLLNRTAGDIDTANPGVAMGLRTTTGDNGHYIQFVFNATLFSNMSLSFAVDSAGNGFNNVQLLYSITPGHADASFVSVGSLAILSAGGFHILTFGVPSAVNGQPDVALRLTCTGGASMGNNLE